MKIKQNFQFNVNKNCAVNKFSSKQGLGKTPGIMKLLRTLRYFFMPW